MNKQVWTKYDETFLKENYSGMLVREIATTLGRSESSVYHKARRIGLVHGRWWTDDEISFLKENYNTMPHKEIAVALRKTVSGIEGLGSTLGLTRGNYNPPERYCLDCGKKLANKYMNPERCEKCSAINRSGAKSHLWKGGVSPIYKIVQRGLWKAWKLPILKRDGFKCQACGDHKNLEVHHIRKYVTIRDDVLNDNKNLSIKVWAERKKLAEIIIDKHRIEWGITLCKKCHLSCHAEKPGELLGSPNVSGEGNQQPSRSNVVSIVGRKVQRLTGEDTTPNKPDTSAWHAKQIA